MVRGAKRTVRLRFHASNVRRDSALRGSGTTPAAHTAQLAQRGDLTLEWRLAVLAEAVDEDLEVAMRHALLEGWIEPATNRPGEPGEHEADVGELDTRRATTLAARLLGAVDVGQQPSS